MKTSFFTRAETILEVVVAISVIMIILAPASGLYIASVRTVATNRNDLTAAALAEEGIEIVRNIRDTNFMKFSNKARDCWNTVPGHTDGATCDAAANKIAEGSYRLFVNADNTSPNYLKWSLNSATAVLHENAEGKYDLQGEDDEDYRLRLDALDIAVRPECTNAPGEARAPPDCHVHFQDDTHLYYHAAGSAGSESPFYREVTIEYINSIEPPAGPDWTAGVDVIKVFSRVLYRTGTAVRAIERVAFLTREPS